MTAQPCPADVCISDTVPMPAGGGAQADGPVYSGGPDEIAADLDAIDEAINGFVTWLGSLLPRSNEPIPNRDAQNHAAPHGQLQGTSEAEDPPDSPSELEDFTRAQLDGPNVMPADRAENPFDRSLRSLTAAPPGVDPTRAQAGSTEVEAAVADPVDLGSGAFVLREIDVSLPGAAGPLEFVREYSSRSGGRTILGSNWTHSYDSYVRPVTVTNAPPGTTPLDLEARDPPLWVVVAGHGRMFHRTSFGYVSVLGSGDTLHVVDAGYELRQPDGRVLTFDSDGDLVSNRDRFGNVTTLQYERTPLRLLYEAYCLQPVAGAPELDEEKACRQLAHVFGDASPREFIHQAPWANGRKILYREEVRDARALGREMEGEHAAGTRRDLLIAFLGPSFPARVDAADDPELLLAVTVSDAARHRWDLFKRLGISRSALGRHSSVLFAGLRADGVFEDDAGALRHEGTSLEERDRLTNFNLALSCEVLIPRQCDPLFDYESHPAFQPDAGGTIPYRPLAPGWSSPPTAAHRATFDRAHAELAPYLFQPDGTPVGRTRQCAAGDRPKRLVRVTDSMGRSLDFTYHVPGEDGGGREGLLKEIRGPAGIRLTYEYVRPWMAPHFLNEVFLKAARRVDVEPGVPGLRRAAPRSRHYELAWQDADAAWFQRWAWAVWRQHVARQDPRAPWLSGQYFSDALDNVIRVWNDVGTSDIELEVENLFQANPLAPEFDRVIEQRHGPPADSPPGRVLVEGYEVMEWRSRARSHRFEYGLGSVARIESLLPTEIRQRYPLEPLPPHLQGHARTPFHPYFAVPLEAVEALRLKRSRVSAEQMSAVGRYVGHDLSAWLATGETLENLDGSARTLDAYRTTWAGGTSAAGIWFTETTADVDANRITSWVKSTDRESRVTWFGLNHAGLPLVTARSAPNDLTVIGDEFLYEERTYDGHGRLTSVRHPTRALRVAPSLTGWPPGRPGRPAAPVPMRRLPHRAATRYRFVHPEPLGDDEFDEAAWHRRDNLVEERQLASGPPVEVLGDDGTTRRVIGEYQAMFYERAYQQPLLMELGSIDEAGRRSMHYQVAWHYDCPSSGARAATASESRRSPAPSPRTATLAATRVVRSAGIASPPSLPSVRARLADAARGPSPWRASRARILEAVLAEDPEGRGRWPGAARLLIDPEWDDPRRPALEPDDALITANACRAPRPRRMVAGRGPLLLFTWRIPESARVVEYEWNDAGFMTRWSPRGAGATELEYYATGTGGARQQGGRGMLARRVMHRSLRSGALVPGPAEPPCAALAGPLQWLLPATCGDPSADLEARGWDPEAVAILREAMDDEASALVEDIEYFPTGDSRRRRVGADEYRFVRDADGRELEAVQPSGLTVRREHARGGALVREVIESSGVRLWERTFTGDPFEGACEVVDQPGVGGRSQRWERSAEGVLTSSTGADGVSTIVEHDRLGRITASVLRSSGSDEILRTLQEHDDLGRLVRLTSAGNEGGAPDLVTTFAHDGFGRVTRVTDPLRLATSFRYDERGLLVETSHWSAPGSGAPGAEVDRTRSARDEHGEIVRMAASGTQEVHLDRTPDGRIWRERRGTAVSHAAYDPSGALAWFRASDGQEDVVLDAPWRRRRVLVHVSAPPERSVVTTMQSFGPSGEMVEEISRAGGRELRATWAHDALGRIASSTDPLGEQLRTTRDALGRTVRIDSIAPGDPPGAAHAVELHWDARGRCDAITDPGGHVTRWIRDDFGRVLSESRPGVLKPRTFRHDELGRLVSECRHGAGCLQYAWEAGRLARVEAATSHGGVGVPYLEFAYGPDGRLARSIAHNTLAGGAADPARRVTVTFDRSEEGRNVLMTTQVGTAGISWGVRSRWSAPGEPASRSVNIEGLAPRVQAFDPSGRVVSEDHGDGGPAFAFDWSGRDLTRIAASLGGESGGLVGERSRDAFGALARLTWSVSGPGASTAASAGPDGRLAEQRIVRRADGRVRAESLWWPGLRLGSVSVHDYDGRGRWRATASGRPSGELDEATLSSGELADEPWMTQDAIIRSPIGSVTARHDRTGSITSQAIRGPGHLLESVTSGAESWTGLSDRTGRAARAGDAVFAYDGAEKLRSVTTPSGTAEYLQDAFGRVVARVDPTGLRELLVREGPNLVATLDGSGSVAWEASWAPDGSLLWWREASSENGAVVLSDRALAPRGTWRGAGFPLESVTDVMPDGARRVSSADGAIACADSGLDMACDGTAGLPFGMAGAWRAREGLLLFGQRWYSVPLGEFLTPDPLGFEDSFDLRGYAGFDPVNRRDPTGMSSEGFDSQEDVENLMAGIGVRLAQRLGAAWSAGMGHGGPLGLVIGAAMMGAPDDALASSPDPSLLAGMNPALHAQASTYAALDAVEQGQPFLAGTHVVDSAFGTVGTVTFAQGLGAIPRAVAGLLPRALAGSSGGFLRSFVLARGMGNGAQPPSMAAGLPQAMDRVVVIAAPAQEAALVATSASAPVMTAVSSTVSVAAPAVAATSAASSASPILIGTSTSQMRRVAARLIASTAGHPLQFLLNPQGRFWSSRGLDHATLVDHPEIVQMGHITSAKSGEPERIMLQGAWENQFTAITVERSGLQAHAQNAYVVIGDTAVHRGTALFWEEIGWLPPGTVQSAPLFLP